MSPPGTAFYAELPGWPAGSGSSLARRCSHCGRHEGELLTTLPLPLSSSRSHKQTTSSSPRASAVLRWATLAGLFLLPMLRLRLVARGHRISPGMLVALLLLDGACMVLAYGHYAANDAGAACAASEPLSMRRLHHGAADDAEAAACSDDDDDDDDAVGEPGDGRGCWSFALETAAVVLNVMLTAWVQW